MRQANPANCTFRDGGRFGRKPRENDSRKLGPTMQTMGDVVIKIVESFHGLMSEVMGGVGEGEREGN